MDETQRPVTVGVPREQSGDEKRVALVPDTVAELTKQGLEIVIQAGAGMGASIDDEAYFVAGAAVEAQAATVYERSDIIVKVRPPSLDEIGLFRPGTLLISFLDPFRDSDVVQHLATQGVTAFSFNTVPRITRAQSMDAMSAMSTVGGYKAVLLAANALGRFFPLLMTAAGTVAPARVFVIGAGVAGLQALATARRLGAVTSACDARPAVKEQVQSVGASFVEMVVPTHAEGEGGYAREMDDEYYRQERESIQDHVAAADVVISTAMVPGARAPVLINESMVREMKAGSVIVDMAGEAGGNCELSVPGESVVRYGITIISPLNLPSQLPVHASQMYARNVTTVLKLVVQDGTLRIDDEDEIIRSACLTRADVASK